MTGAEESIKILLTTSAGGRTPNHDKCGRNHQNPTVLLTTNPTDATIISMSAFQCGSLGVPAVPVTIIVSVK